MLHTTNSTQNNTRLKNDISLTQLLVRGIRVTTVSLGILLSASQSTFAAADTPSSMGGEDVYQAAFFAQYTPQNAMDMIRRLPGFSFKRGSDVRGFGGAAGNVLIDGSRPTSKSGGLRSALERIPAAQVERIEILRGGVSAGEAAGQSIVANVVRKLGGSSGTWKVTSRRQPIRGNIHPHIEGTITTTLGAWNTSFDINTGFESFYRQAEIVERDAADELVGVTDETYDVLDKWFVVSAEGSRALAGGKLTLNGRLDRFHDDKDTDRLEYIGRFPSGSNETLWNLEQSFDKIEVEFGITWNRTFANGWRVNTIGLVNINDSGNKNATTDTDLLLNTSSFSEYIQDRDKSEYIVRTTYGKTTGRLKPEFGIEVARNTLDNHVEDYSDGILNAEYSEDVNVKEVRAEAFATLTYQPIPKLSLDSGLTFEASRINVTGDAVQEQNFKFLKPRVSSTYRFNGDVQLTLEAERTVGQLNLNDFGASQQAADDRAVAGNPNLRPDKKTKIAAIFNWKFSERGSLRVEAKYEWRTDILEQIILPSGGEGKGNAGDAEYWAIRTDLNIPLDFILTGALIEIEHKFRRSRFSDPVIGGAFRNINRFTPHSLEIKFRQDLTEHKVAWGLEYDGYFISENFNVAQFRTFEGNHRLSFFVETTRYFGVKARLDVANAKTGIYTRSRFFYDGSRAGDYTGSIISRRRQYPHVKFSISGTF